jgi:hypothetical protein
MQLLEPIQPFDPLVVDVLAGLRSFRWIMPTP